MGLLPLPLSAHFSAWTADAGPVGGRDATPSAPCRFCGFSAGNWQERFHCNGDHADNTAVNLVSVCPLCHLTQHPERPQIDTEVTLIWMPEMSQAVLNCLVRGIHVFLHGYGEPPGLRRSPLSFDPGVAEAYRAYRALQERTGPALDRLGTNSFAELGAALLGLRPDAYARRAELLAGLRLLPLGQLHQDGCDVYPKMLATWTPKLKTQS